MNINFWRLYNFFFKMLFYFVLIIFIKFHVIIYVREKN